MGRKPRFFAHFFFSATITLSERITECQEIYMQILAASYLLPITAEPIPGGAVAIENGVITAVGTLSELRKAISAPVYEYPGCAIMPGLINSHTHLELTHFPAWLLRKDLKYTPRTFVDWIIQVIKVKRGLKPEDLSVSIQEGIDISLQAGTTMVGDILSDYRLLQFYAGKLISGRIYFELIGHGPSHCSALLDEILNQLPNVPPQLLAGLSPHTPFTVSKDFLKDIASIANKMDIPLSIHLSESREESDFFYDTTGKIATELYPFTNWEQYLPSPLHTTPAGWLRDTALFGTRFHAVHCVQCTPSDADILSSVKAPIVLCPRSNEKLDVGRAPVHLFKSRDIPLALGTDSLASNDSLSMWDEMRALMRIFPGEFTPLQVISMATINGARVLHREQEAGSLEKGKRADLLLLEPVDKEFGNEIYGQILSSSRVKGVWCGGNVAVRPV